MALLLFVTPLSPFFGPESHFALFAHPLPLASFSTLILFMSFCVPCVLSVALQHFVVPKLLSAAAAWPKLPAACEGHEPPSRRLARRDALASAGTRLGKAEPEGLRKQLVSDGELSLLRSPLSRQSVPQRSFACFWGRGARQILRGNKRLPHKYPLQSACKQEPAMPPQLRRVRALQDTWPLPTVMPRRVDACFS